MNDLVADSATLEEDKSSEGKSAYDKESAESFLIPEEPYEGLIRSLFSQLLSDEITLQEFKDRVMEVEPKGLRGKFLKFIEKIGLNI